MIEAIMKILIALLFLTTIIDSVKIGISKPVVISENVTTEGTTLEPTTTRTTTTTVKIISTPTTTRATTINSTQTTKQSQKTTTSTSTTTPIPPTTTTVALPKNDSRPSPIRKTNFDRSGYFCSCDLRPNFCDTNCCCDIDCIPEELNSFDCHREDNRLEDFNYLQGLPPCRINEGWLCVFRTNIDVSQKHLNYIFDKSIFHEWPQLLKEDNDLGRDRSYYKIGEPVLLYNLEVNEITEFDLPFSLVGHHCQINESVRHLKTKNSSCHLSLEKAKTLETTLFEKLCTSYLLQGPNTQVPLDGIIKETLSEFIPITIYRCSKEYDCVPVSINNSYFEYLDESTYSNLIQTKLTHNHTNLISCEVFFVQSEEKSSEIWLSFEVDFVHVNETQGNSLNKVSGPLGYTVGRPLIIAHKVLLNESLENDDSNRIFNYFHPNKTQEIHISVPKRRRDRCEDGQRTLNFGESILVECSVQLDNSTEVTRDSNFTKICTELQNKIFNILQVSQILELQEDYYMSILGYPVNQTDYWTKIELTNYEHLPVLGVYLDKEDSFICENIILGVKYELLIVKEEVNGVRHQNLLHRATIELEKRHDLQFQFDEIVSIPVTFSTVFHDLQEVNSSMKWTTLPMNVLMGFIVITSFNYMKT